MKRLARTNLKESDIKLQIKDYLKYRHIFNYHITQTMGSYPGLPDRVLHYRGRVIYLEIKRPNGELSIHQQAFGERCVEDDIAYWVVDSVEKLEALLNKAGRT